MANRLVPILIKILWSQKIKMKLNQLLFPEFWESSMVFVNFGELAPLTQGMIGSDEKINSMYKY